MTASTSTSESYGAKVRAELRACRTDHVRFNQTVLGRSRYWSKQQDIARSVTESPVTLVPTGNAVGKSFVDAGEVIAFLCTNPNSLVLATAPTQIQLEEVLWKEVERAYSGSKVPIGGRLLRSPLKIDFGEGWQALAYSTTKVERFSGHHGKDVLAVGDEASGIADEISDAIASLNPSRELYTGNPLRPSGWFYERCTQAAAGKNPLARLIQISSLDSPHIGLERSPWGLADATWLAKSRNDYGENSLWWTTHVLGLFPDSAEDTVLPRHWIDRAAASPLVRSGVTRTSIDLGLGNGGDRSVVMTRDDNGLLALEHDRNWSLETTATKAALQVQRYNVAHHRVSWDVEGIGADFANRLAAVGVVGARPYRGGGPGGKRYGNLRAAAAWAFRQRLDPLRESTPGTVQPPFSIRPEWVALMREELQGLRYTHDNKGSVCLETAEDFAKRLRHSPDFQACLCQSFAFTG